MRHIPGFEPGTLTHVSSCLSVVQSESFLKGTQLNFPLKRHVWTEESGAADTRGRSCSRVSPNLDRRPPPGVAGLVWTAASAGISFIISRITGRGLLGAIRSNRF